MAGKLTAYTWPWMTGAAILVAGFMYWLYLESSAIEPATIAADTVEQGLPKIPDTAFVRDPSQFSRQRVLLSPVRIADNLGRAVLTVDLPGVSGYPLILDRSVTEEGLSLVAGDNVSVAGQVYALNDSLIDVYLQRGLFNPENRPKLEGHATFFLVDSLDFVFPGETGSGSVR